MTSKEYDSIARTRRHSPEDFQNANRFLNRLRKYELMIPHARILQLREMALNGDIEGAENALKIELESARWSDE